MELQGHGNHHAVQELVDIVQAQDPMIVFLSETWSTKEKMKWVRDNISFDECFTITTDERRGGLALLWKVGVNVWVDSFSKYHIDAIIHGGSDQAWRLTGFYGEPNTSLRSEGWNMSYWNMSYRSRNYLGVVLVTLMSYLRYMTNGVDHLELTS